MDYVSEEAVQEAAPVLRELCANFGVKQPVLTKYRVACMQHLCSATRPTCDGDYNIYIYICIHVYVDVLHTYASMRLPSNGSRMSMLSCL